jgi:hypothetical protein
MLGCQLAAHRRSAYPALNQASAKQKQWRLYRSVSQFTSDTYVSNHGIFRHSRDTSRAFNERYPTH